MQYHRYKHGKYVDCAIIKEKSTTPDWPKNSQSGLVRIYKLIVD